jgi:(E)-4-hydroxy-3-methylbut-2-enyl-diphosphate synthase
MLIKRKITKQIVVGGVTIGGDAPVRIQSMTNTKTTDVARTIDQINQLEAAGCELVRVSVPDEPSAAAVSAIKAGIGIPLIVDVHFNWQMAMKSMEGGADCVRINPGNMKDEEIASVAREAGRRGIAMRVGVNAGSLRSDILEEFGHPVPEALVKSALRAADILEAADFDNFKISVKASSAGDTIDSYRLLSEETTYPLHIGVSEAGPAFSGTIKSSVGLGILLSEGIGDTMRVSLTADPVEEIKVAREILSSLGLLEKVEIISCPTCARTESDLIKLVSELEDRLTRSEYPPIKIAVMGCVVNGPGEAREADIGIAGGKGKGVLFRNGEVIRNVNEADYLAELMREIDIIKETYGTEY